MTELNITAACLKGCVRENNEDMILVGDTFLREDGCERSVSLHHSDRYLMAVADGMGGHRCGELASSEALTNLHFFFNDIPTGLSPEAFSRMLNEWLRYINVVFESKGLTNPEYKGMGTTLVALVFFEGEFFSLNCGDSRLYRYRDGVLSQLSTDHSLSQLLGEEKHSSSIVNCIGGGCKKSYLDIVHMHDQLLPGDRFILCSDGLTDMLSDSYIEGQLSESADAERLCEEAIRFGGHDNVSVCMIHVKN
ncbi:MAG: protein phosphatase 2C domain-containing protein [Prevotella sp.]|nr:protein phosphatase 2C domain-containing protein [Prevotella sp.]